MTSPFYDQAFRYYQVRMASVEGSAGHGFTDERISSTGWERFGAELLDRDRGIGLGRGHGYTDLEGVEVKSRQSRASAIDYQYHHNCGLQKLAAERHSQHLIILYDNDCRDVEVYLLQPAFIHELTAAHNWRTYSIARYHDGIDPITGRKIADDLRGDRCRPTGITPPAVRKNGQLLMRIRDKKMVFTAKDVSLEGLLRPSPLCLACVADHRLPIIRRQGNSASDNEG